MPGVTTPSRDLSLIALKFRRVVEDAIAACARQGFDVKVQEAFRSQERQSWLYGQGRTRAGPIVTSAPTSLTSWHGYGLAVDVIHKTMGYEPAGKGRAFAKANELWFAKVGAIFKKQGCDWGGDWKKPDTPHMQWGRCPASPSADAKAAMKKSGAKAVWAMYGAD